MRRGRVRRGILALIAVAALALAGCTPTPSVPATGETTTVEVRMLENRYEPNVIEVPLGDRLVIELINEDVALHDLDIEGGVASERLGMGQRETLDVGVIGADLDGWCTIPPHREHGMVLEIRVT